MGKHFPDHGLEFIMSLILPPSFIARIQFIKCPIAFLQEVQVTDSAFS